MIISDYSDFEMSFFYLENISWVSYVRPYVRLDEEIAILIHYYGTQTRGKIVGFYGTICISPTLYVGVLLDCFTCVGLMVIL